MEFPKFSVARAMAEISVIVLGVLVALGLEGWREDVADRALELEYLERLQSEFESDSRRIAAAMQSRKTQQGHIDVALEVLAGEGASTNDELLSVFMASRSVWSREIGGITFQELTGTGRLQLVSNADLRIQLVGFYSWISVAIVNAPGLLDRTPYRDIVRGEIYPALQESLRSCGGVEARILGLPDMNMVSACQFEAGAGDATAIINRIRAHPEALPAIRRWAAAFTALEIRLEESHNRINEMKQVIATEIARHRDIGGS